MVFCPKLALHGVAQPGLGGQAVGLEGGDLVLVAQRQADVVKAIEQAVAAEWQHVERDLFTLRPHDDLALQVDGELVAGEGVHLVEQLGHGGFGQHDGQHAVLEAVAEEDVGKAGRDDRAKAVLLQRPGRVLAAGAAAKVAPGQQDAGARVARLVEHEVWVGLARRFGHAGLAGLVQVAPFVEQVGAKPRALDRLEELLGNDGVGIDVLAIHGGHKALVYGEFLHGVLTCWRRARWRCPRVRCPAPRP
jgi:hypothetical protein